MIFWMLLQFYGGWARIFRYGRAPFGCDTTAASACEILVATAGRNGGGVGEEGTGLRPFRGRVRPEHAPARKVGARASARPRARGGRGGAGGVGRRGAAPGGRRGDGRQLP